MALSSTNQSSANGSSAPSPTPEEQRVEVLHSYNVLDTEPEASFDRITELAAQIFDVPISIVNFIDADRQWFKSSFGLQQLQASNRGSHLEIPFCERAIETPDPMAVEDAAEDERFAETDLVAEGGIRFYAGAPLTASEANRIGTLCLLDTTPRSFSDEQKRQLESLAALAMDELDLRAARTVLEEQNEQIGALSSALTAAEERERKRISAVLHDDLQQILSAVQMNLDQIEENAPSELLETVKELMSKAIETTRTLSTELNPPIGRESLRDTFEWMAIHMRKAYGLNIELEISEPEIPPSEDLCSLLFRTTRELLFNVVKHADVEHARVSLTATDSGLRVVVEDDGVGFDPTSLVEEERSDGLGLFSVRDRIEMLGGQLFIDSAPGDGTCVTLEVPTENTNGSLVAAYSSSLVELP